LQKRFGAAAEVLPPGRPANEHQLAAYRHRLRECHAPEHRAVREEQHRPTTALLEGGVPTGKEYAPADRQFLLLCKYFKLKRTNWQVVLINPLNPFPLAVAPVRAAASPSTIGAPGAADAAQAQSAATGAQCAEDQAQSEPAGGECRARCHAPAAAAAGGRAAVRQDLIEVPHHQVPDTTTSAGTRVQACAVLRFGGVSDDQQRAWIVAMPGVQQIGDHRYPGDRSVHLGHTQHAGQLGCGRGDHRFIGQLAGAAAQWRHAKCTAPLECS